MAGSEPTEAVDGGAAGDGVVERIQVLARLLRARGVEVSLSELTQIDPSFWYTSTWLPSASPTSTRLLPLT